MNSPFGKLGRFYKTFSFVIILHQMAFSIDISSIWCLIEALQSSLQVVTYAMSVKIHNPKDALRFQASIPTSFWVPKERLQKNNFPKIIWAGRRKGFLLYSSYVDWAKDYASGLITASVATQKYEDCQSSKWQWYCICSWHS